MTAELEVETLDHLGLIAGVIEPRTYALTKVTQCSSDRSPIVTIAENRLI
jgi:hypothetical protein